MTNPTKRDDILRKLTAMKALANDPSTSEEQKLNILAKMQKWMEEYRLTETDIGIKEEGITGSANVAGKPSKRAKIVPMGYVVKAIVALSNTVLSVPAHNTFAFIGTPTDVQFADFLFSVCHTAITQNWNAYENSMDYLVKVRGKTTAGKAAIRDAFCYQMAYRLSARIFAMVPPVPTGTGLVVLKNALIEAYMKNNGIPGYKDTKSITLHDDTMDVRLVAEAEANKVLLQKGMKAEETLKLEGK